MITLVHVIAGAIVMIVAPASLLALKGSRWHKRWGNIFAIAMAVVLLSAGFMWQPKGHLFLFTLSIVSAYFIFSGFRVVRRRRRMHHDPIENVVDVGAAVVAAVMGVWLLFIAFGAASELMRSLAPIMGTLGVIALAFAGNDTRGVIVRQRSRIGWLLVHVSAMLAAYISAVTAFVVINVHGVPMQVRWLVPGLLGAMLISGYSIRIRKIDLRRYFPARRRRLVAASPERSEPA